MPGLSGKVQFDSFGVRTNVSFSLVELKESGLTEVSTIIQLECSLRRCCEEAGSALRNTRKYLERTPFYVRLTLT